MSVIDSKKQTKFFFIKYHALNIKKYFFSLYFWLESIVAFLLTINKKCFDWLLIFFSLFISFFFVIFLIMSIIFYFVFIYRYLFISLIKTN